MGDVNNGMHPVNLAIANVTVGPTNTVAFSYSILNSGFNGSAFGAPLEKLVNSAAAKAAGLGAAAVRARHGRRFPRRDLRKPRSKGGTWAIGKLDDILFANCDGSVAGFTHGLPELRSPKEPPMVPSSPEPTTIWARLRQGLRRELALLRQLDNRGKSGGANPCDRRRQTDELPGRW